MEEKKKKKQEEKKKKEAAQKKAAEQKTKVPDSAKPSPTPPPPTNPSVPSASSSTDGNGKHAPSSNQQQQQPPAPRYPPREVPPRFRQHEHKQLLKRGHPLPAGSTALVQPVSANPTSQLFSCQTHPELPPQSSLAAQYENISPSRSATTASTNSCSSWDPLIIDECDTEAWPSISCKESHAPAGCPLDTESISDISSMSMATGAGQQGHFSTNHPSKANASHSGGLLSSQGGASRGWGPGPSLAGGGEGKNEVSSPSGGTRGWGSSNFNLNLNPNANPSAWPVLGHEGNGVGGGSSGESNPPPNICSPPGTLPSQGPSSSGSIGGANGNSAGNGGSGNGSTTWGSIVPSDSSEPHSTPSTNVSFSSEPQNLNTDGPNHTKQEPRSPGHSLANWGVGPSCMSSFVQNPGGASQVNGDEEPAWGNGDAKSGSGSKDSGWDSGSSWGQGGTSGTSDWGQAASTGDWGKHSNNEPKGWDSSSSPTQEQHLNSWVRGAKAPASEGSSDSMECHPRRRVCSSRDEASPILPAQDMDPRVLCNTGWGQTPVRQHTAWETKEAARSNCKNDIGTEAWGSSSNAANVGPTPTSGSANPNSGTTSRPDSGGKNEGPCPSTGAGPGWGTAMPSPQASSGWADPTSNKKPSSSPGSWSCTPAGGSSGNLKKSGQTWGSEEKSPTWEDSHAKAKPQGWTEGPNHSHGWNKGPGGENRSGGEWGEPGDEKKNIPSSSTWDGEGTGWNEGSRGWGKPAPGTGGNWGDAQQPSMPSQGWNNKPQEGTNSNSGSGSMGSWGGPSSVKQSGSGWGGGNGGGVKPDHIGEPTGWDEPSPHSIRRKMEIDDGTSAWGDPSSYNKTVNLWDRNNPVIQGKPGPGNANNVPNNHHPHPHHNQPPMQTHSHGGSNSNNNHISPDNAGPHPTGPSHNRTTLMNPGWGEMTNVHSKPEPSWGEPATPAASVDNGTSAWGKPSGGWGDNGPEVYGRGSGPPGSAPCKPAPKSMQDGWGGGEDMGLSAGQWEQDEGDMWNSTASQESNSSCNSWGNPPKKGPPKGKVPNKQDDTWIMNRLIKQLTDMGFPRDPAEEALKSNNMNLDQAMSALLEKKTELDKRGMGISDYNNGLVNKPMGCRPSVISKESSSDRPPFLDKDAGLADDAQTSPFMPSPSLKLPLGSAALSGQSLGVAMQNLNNRQMQSGVFGSSGAAQARALQQQPPPQPSVPHLNSSQPSLRAQVPQFFSPQVQAQLLQFAAKNIGLNPALLTSPINPQHMTLLNQLYQLQLAYQRLQIQQQMLQAQRSVSGPIRQQEQQVARTINNMQQQIQQHQRQLAQALLMKQQQQQQQQPPTSHPGLHPSAGKSALDLFPAHPQASSLSVSDLQTKEPQSSPNSFSPYTISGLNHNMNVNCMEVGGLSMKDSPQPQSRLSQWTHPNSMENLSGCSSPMESNFSKHGAISAGPSLGPPSKPTLDDSYNPYNLLPSSESPNSPLVPHDSWGQGKNTNDKLSNGTNVSWPPEFCPGVPWKGLQNIDPETDPNVTPGSVPSGPTINTNIQDVNRYLLRDRSGGSTPTSSMGEALPPSSDWPVTSSFSLSSHEAASTGKLSDMKSTWSPGPISHTQASLSHELWKVPQGPRNTTAPTRPPPGLTNTKPSSTWGGNTLGLVAGWSSSYSPVGTTWSTDSSSRSTSWLVLRNLTPQIDGSTLRTLCMQHGPLITFHLNLTQGNAVVRYSSKEEAAKAQKSLHMCVLGNTTILAEFAGEEEVNRFFAQGQSLTPTTSWQANPGTNQTRLGGGGTVATHPIGHWNSSGLGGGGASGMGSGGKASNELLWGGVPQYSSLWGPPSAEDGRVVGSPTPINTLLPGDLLSGESM
ncbi:trinucleotide repeat-containing gene 6C protein-like isoform X1 [Carassius carassius]|uniref:trinucleotide repeat-containing gene 6C protein-like isoform X1 n=1 Tax=Carassius carassius TaxID=217509 RepID=UPI00286919F4|nr:trinucleotide repeat-containing gene 6C protein-like isoform X1 [Carassius carassius]XP_059414320.1 trinucleotide repeat-containing gene 6C protein-like isoform X1 [Carassius carassius]